MGVFYAGYAVDGAVIVTFLIVLTYLACCVSKPKFMKYTNNNEQDNHNKATKDSPKATHQSIKLEEEEGKIEFMRADGRPENFLGLQNMSSRD